MRFASYERSGDVAVGVVDGQQLWPLASLDARPLEELVGEGLEALLDLGSRARDSSSAIDLESLRLLAPLRPPAIRDFTTFEQHVEGMMLLEGLQGIAPAFYVSPPFYFSNPHAVAGPHDDVMITPGSELFDYELEIGAVIGTSGTNLTSAQARQHIIGYTIFNDWSGRDVLLREIKGKLGPVKSKDTTNTLGPWLVTADELEGHRNEEGFLDLTMRVWLNDELMGTDSLANSSWAFEDLVALASRGAWVRAGDLIGSGTCGTGCLAEGWGRHGLESQRPLAAGDVVTMEVEGIGRMSNRVVPGPAVLDLPAGRHRLVVPT